MKSKVGKYFPLAFGKKNILLGIVLFITQNYVLKWVMGLGF
jgi:hypothetical protein